MAYNILIFSSITYALKAQGKLESSGIKSKLEKLRKEHSMNGCGYGLKIANNDVINAKRLLDKEGIIITNIFDHR